MVEYPFSADFKTCSWNTKEARCIWLVWCDIDVCQSAGGTCQCCSNLLHSGGAIIQWGTGFHENAFKPKSCILLLFLLYAIRVPFFFPNHAFTFDSVQSAQRAKASLNGADIYSGCCTLKIEYAKVVLAFLCMSYQSKPIQQPDRKCNSNLAVCGTFTNALYDLIIIQFSYMWPYKCVFFSRHAWMCSRMTRRPGTTPTLI